MASLTSHGTAGRRIGMQSATRALDSAISLLPVTVQARLSGASVGPRNVARDLPKACIGPRRSVHKCTFCKPTAGQLSVQLLAIRERCSKSNSRSHNTVVGTHQQEHVLLRHRSCRGIDIRGHRPLQPPRNRDRLLTSVLHVVNLP